MTAFIQYAGVLRVLLYLLALTGIGFSQFAGDGPVYSGWGVIPTLVAPALAPILFFVLLLDVTMSAVFMVDKTGSTRRRFRHILLMDLVLAGTLLGAWMPFMLSLGN